MIFKVRANADFPLLGTSGWPATTVKISPLAVPSRAHTTHHPIIKHHESKRNCSVPTKESKWLSGEVTYPTHLFGLSASRVQTSSRGDSSVAPHRLSWKTACSQGYYR